MSSSFSHSDHSASASSREEVAPSEAGIFVRKDGRILSLDGELRKILGIVSIHRVSAKDILEEWETILSRNSPWKGTLVVRDKAGMRREFSSETEWIADELLWIRLIDPRLEEKFQEQFFQIFHKNLAIKLIIDAETGEIVDVSDSALEFYGYSRKEFSELKISEVNILNPEQIKTEMMKASSENRLYFNFIHRLKSGELRDVEVFSGPISLNRRIYLYSIIHDVTDRNLALEAKALSERKYKNLIELAADAIVLLNSSGTIEEANQMSSELTGYSRERMIGMSVYEIIDSENLMELPLNLSFEEGTTLIRERVIRKSDGAKVPVEINAVRLEQGKLLAVVRDITERKLAQKRMEDTLQEKELMLKEIHHRVKNNLQIVSSLLSFHSEINEDEVLQKILKECELRVKSMALVHEELYRSDDLAQVDLKNYSLSLASNLLSIYGRSSGVRIHNFETSFLISIDRAIPIGLILNELLANSLKYAFAEAEKGEIFLNLTEEDGTLHLEYRDTGNGFDWEDARKRQSGLGLKLIEMLSLQLHAKLSFRSEKGFYFRMSFPGW
ncbi:PAS domain S-box protein [Leptospira ellisii]|uniref:histidine kinase n=4 Tax=Leptospira ellisii TaxID=2023197 RepID=A0AAE4QM13_9LEPT|nr:PAS domain S-box protein [Leptospira ellisii]MDV6235255.1 PAS domain S-box protein [Leptospira ellisii]